MAIHESGENYLEAILMLKEENDTVRSVDIASKLGFSKPSVSRAMAILKADGLITMDSSGLVDLTKSGEKKAKLVLERHRLIAEYLEKALGVSEVNAAEDACQMEHDISEETFLRMKEWVKANK